MKVNIGSYSKRRSIRKVKIEIEQFDTWSLDHTLALIIYPALLQLKDTKQGVPSEFAEVGGEEYTDQTSFDFYTDTCAESRDEGIKRWDEILDKMIWSFQQLVGDDYSSAYHHGEAKYEFVKTDKTFPNPVSGKVEKTFRLLDTNPEDHWYDHEGHSLHEERIQEGLMLFGKHYRSLWN
jgi:hypothetical protein